MPEILVTGASGFIGRHLCKGLIAAGHRVLPLSRSHGDIATRKTLQSLAGFRHVFHLAGITYVPESWNDPFEFHRVNVLGTINVLEYCRQHKARLTYVSSYLYGVPDSLPVSEDLPPKPNNPYALSKHLAEQACQFYASQLGLDVSVIRPFNVYGEGQDKRFLVQQIVDQVVCGQTVSVMDLAPRRDFIYVADLVSALCKTIEGPGGHRVFNIGSGKSVSVGELIETVQRVAGSALPVVSRNQVRRNEIDDVYADCSRAAEELGWVPRYSLEEGLLHMFQSISSGLSGKGHR